MGMGLGGGPGRHQAMSEINVTPLVDIMLVLLIIFMVTAPLLQQGVEVNLPEEDTAALSTTNAEPLVVSVTRDGQPSIEGRTVTMETLVEKLTAIRNNRPDLTIFIRGDKDTAYGSVMAVMAGLQRAGFTQIGLVTEPQ
ncbi:protein TolR [Magnetococcales bacterium HHB-1]